MTWILLLVMPPQISCITSKKGINFFPQFSHLQNGDNISVMKRNVARLHSFVFCKVLCNPCVEDVM